MMMLGTSNPRSSSQAIRRFPDPRLLLKLRLLSLSQQHEHPPRWMTYRYSRYLCNLRQLRPRPHSNCHPYRISSYHNLHSNLYSNICNSSRCSNSPLVPTPPSFHNLGSLKVDSCNSRTLLKVCHKASMLSSKSRASNNRNNSRLGLRGSDLKLLQLCSKDR